MGAITHSRPSGGSASFATLTGEPGDNASLADALAEKAPVLLPPSDQSGDYTFALGDLTVAKISTSAVAVEWTIPANVDVEFPVGCSLFCIQAGDGAVTFVPDAGVTLESVGAALTTSGVNAGVTLYKRGENLWQLFGNLTA